MENYILYGEINSTPARTVFKGRLRQTILFVCIHQYNLSLLDHVTVNVQFLHTFKHQNIIQFIEWYQSPQHVWVVTELINGGTLTEVMDADGPMTASAATGFFVDVASGLRYVHLQGVVLCDLTPSKVLVDCSGTLKIGDFCFSQRSSKHCSRWTLADIKHSLEQVKEIFKRETSSENESKCLARHITLESLPSPFYMSPEALTSAEFTHYSDMWSLGCILYELMTGQCPFGGIIDKELLTAVVLLADNRRNVTEDARLQNILDGLLCTNKYKRMTWNSEELLDIIK